MLSNANFARQGDHNLPKNYYLINYFAFFTVVVYSVFKYKNDLSLRMQLYIVAEWENKINYC